MIGALAPMGGKTEEDHLQANTTVARIEAEVIMYIGARALIDKTNSQPNRERTIGAKAPIDKTNMDFVRRVTIGAKALIDRISTQSVTTPEQMRDNDMIGGGGMKENSKILGQGQTEPKTAPSI